MYSLPNIQELDFLIGLEILTIEIYQYAIVICFINSSVEINCYRDNIAVFDPIVNNNQLLVKYKDNLIKHKIISCYIQDTDLYLSLDNNYKLILSSADSNYECFTISSDKAMFVV